MLDRASKYKKILIPFVVLLLLIPIVLYGISLNQKTQEEIGKIEKLTSGKAESDAKDLVSEVGKLIQLPVGVVPNIATISDTSKLQDQEFFIGALNGDKLLIYTEPRLVILYRPSTNKIINASNQLVLEGEVDASEVAGASESAEQE